MNHDVNAMTTSTSPDEHERSLDALRGILQKMGPGAGNPDVYTVSPKVYASLRDECGGVLDAEAIPPLMGIPVQVVGTKDMLVEMARRYAKQGKKVGVVGLSDSWMDAARAAVVLDNATPGDTNGIPKVQDV